MDKIFLKLVYILSKFNCWQVKYIWKINTTKYLHRYIVNILKVDTYDLWALKLIKTLFNRIKREQAIKKNLWSEEAKVITFKK